jgi:hypothetical protein
VAADFDELTFAFGGGDDHLNDTGYAIPLALTVDGGSGNDVLGVARSTMRSMEVRGTTPSLAPVATTTSPATTATT